MARLPGARWHQWDPVGPMNAYAGTRLAFNADLSVQYALDRAAIVVCLDADLLGAGNGHLRYARQFAARRRPDGPGIRLYSVEGMPTPTGARADHRLPRPPGAIDAFARQLAAGVGVRSVSTGPDMPSDVRAWIEAVRADLVAHRGSSLVVAGESQPPIVHALAHAM